MGSSRVESTSTGATRPVRVFRVEPGTTWHVRILGDAIAGLFTHWQRGRSVYCLGEYCPPTIHRLPRYWRGYLAVDVFQPTIKKWVPTLLEITEHLELDLRHLVARGQIWELWREVQSGAKNTPVAGKLQETRDPNSVPAAFPILPILQHLFHEPSLDLTAKNPLPDRLLLEDNEGDPPAVLGGNSPEKENLAPPEEIREKIAAFFASRKTPTEKKVTGISGNNGPFFAENGKKT